ncbi:e77fa032-be31-46e3-b973-fc14fc8596c3 [Sclerotinia trifoliorum]|uniref:E77fa032-be31-46e3-b973-fc14fc8596c3 n=1 Tax=Sclerotinia trifoliorum TaxID=28548 RepID=A0A8H2ZN27_9HELO|nr:e77fa032-be31-46e3-b973-fc14fc8596c3 [Sclerotinia trifoliorum]
MESFLKAFRQAGRGRGNEGGSGVYLWFRTLDHLAKNIAADGYASAEDALRWAWDSAMAAQAARLKARDDAAMMRERHRAEVKIFILD